MYHGKIRNLEIILEDKNRKIDKLKSESSGDSPEMVALVTERSQILQELSNLRRLQYEEDYERVRFDDER